ncbi:MAG TPA: alpha/beta fold hydrolase [Aggregatilineaceae bacterium]|nr:alpha/beta fold hydrolase [Aggregatilineaceae bacterium]
MHKQLFLILLIVRFCFAGPATAQDDSLPEPQKIEISAADGTRLVGDYYAPSEPGAPSVLLMHMNGQIRQSWRSTQLLEALYGAGYGVLAVDLRGHGASGGRGTWPLHQADMQTWIAWLRAQPDLDPERVNLLGASLGAVLAIRGMADDDRVVTAVSLSPVDISISLNLEEAVTTIADRPLFLAASQQDHSAAHACKVMIALAQGDALFRLYPGSAHGTAMLTPGHNLLPSIIAWLDQHNGR